MSAGPITITMLNDFEKRVLQDSVSMRNLSAVYWKPLSDRLDLLHRNMPERICPRCGYERKDQ